MKLTPDQAVARVEASGMQWALKDEFIAKQHAVGRVIHTVLSVDEDNIQLARGIGCTKAALQRLDGDTLIAVFWIGD